MSSEDALSSQGRAAGLGADGDARVLADLSRRYRAALSGYFAKRVHDGDEVDDLVQDVFLRLAARSNLGDVEHVKGYLFTTAANVLKDRLRRRASRHVAAHQELSEDVSGADDFTPERVLLGKEELARLVAALQDLPERTRRVFILRRFENLSNGEIAERMGITESGVRFHMIKAKAHLARSMESAR